MSSVPEKPDQNRAKRLQVNINNEEEAVLSGWASYDGVSVTETVRRALGLYTCVRTAMVEGKAVVLVDKDTGHGTEVIFQHMVDEQE